MNSTFCKQVNSLLGLATVSYFINPNYLLHGVHARVPFKPQVIIKESHTENVLVIYLFIAKCILWFLNCVLHILKSMPLFFLFL